VISTIALGNMDGPAIFFRWLMTIVCPIHMEAG
jgi:hypothetical protein